jgi:hypothetical protein
MVSLVHLVLLCRSDVVDMYRRVAIVCLSHANVSSVYCLFQYKCHSIDFFSTCIFEMHCDNITLICWDCLVCFPSVVVCGGGFSTVLIMRNGPKL